VEADTSGKEVMKRRGEAFGSKGPRAGRLTTGKEGKKKIQVPILSSRRRDLLRREENNNNVEEEHGAGGGRRGRENGMGTFRGQCGEKTVVSSAWERGGHMHRCQKKQHKKVTS